MIWFWMSLGVVSLLVYVFIVGALIMGGSEDDKHNGR
jgi:hypothetical protein